ncbi:hypothetical protein CFIO01_03661 [Colletotrichum fioriniae PJ7]|uniref:CBM1 domain-containing protein n=1 Tax=Colletotrichum fioriniae PJ7 TaxID=1445577 RepID=A0A010RNK8_9PEZI|nr:hypothetical protein CFIO01_03661 [Colletotrichum fioriniae PJ7]
MKYITAVIIALAASSNAAVCNYGWGKPAGSTCPGAYPNTYCRVQTSRHPVTFLFPELVRILATDVQFSNRALEEEV